MYTINDYLVKAKLDFEKKINSPNKDYINFHNEISSGNKIIKKNLKSILKKIK